MSEVFHSEWNAKIATLAGQLGIPADKHAALAARIGPEFAAFSRWSPHMTPEAEVKSRISSIIAADLAAELKSKAATHPVADDQKLVCGIDSAIWSKLSPANKIELFRRWQSENGQTTAKPQRRVNVDRLERELDAATKLEPTLKGLARARQLERIQRLKSEIADAKRSGGGQ